jgi:hypothetical protein
LRQSRKLALPFPPVSPAGSLADDHDGPSARDQDRGELDRDLVRGVRGNRSFGAPTTRCHAVFFILRWGPRQSCSGSRQVVARSAELKVFGLVTAVKVCVELLQIASASGARLTVRDRFLGSRDQHDGYQNFLERTPGSICASQVVSSIARTAASSHVHCHRRLLVIESSP